MVLEPHLYPAERNKAILDQQTLFQIIQLLIGIDVRRKERLNGDVDVELMLLY